MMISQLSINPFFRLLGPNKHYFTSSQQTLCRGPTPVGCSQLVVSDPISTEGLTPQLTTKIQPNSTVSCQDGANGGHWFSVQLGKTMWQCAGNVTLVYIRGEGTDDR